MTFAILDYTKKADPIRAPYEPQATAGWLVLPIRTRLVHATIRSTLQRRMPAVRVLCKQLPFLICGTSWSL
jgi:hypothetical protein